MSSSGGATSFAHSRAVTNLNVEDGYSIKGSIPNRYPDSDLRTAKDGQCMKVTGVVTYGNFPLESSFQRVPRCLYIGLACMSTAYRGWRALVIKGYGARVTSNVDESVVTDINPDNKDNCRYIEEGSRVCIMGVVQRNDNVLMIVHPSEPISTGTKIHETC
uniref:Uncharacterized protein n=1 Tax=Oryza glumipatula TaxID=40148 RepID=A0A0E0ASH0_9ORYZ